MVFDYPYQTSSAPVYTLSDWCFDIASDPAITTDVGRESSEITTRLTGEICTTETHGIERQKEVDTIRDPRPTGSVASLVQHRFCKFVAAGLRGCVGRSDEGA